MKLIVGLGNPGRKYQHTRHNIGFICLDQFARKQKLKFKADKKFQGELIKTPEFILLKPSTYMNRSGQSVQSVINYYDISPEECLVIYDDLDIPEAKIRLRENGGDGGHKGMRSILESTGNISLRRLRFGIGKNADMPSEAYVLSTFSKETIPFIEESVQTAVEIIESFLTEEAFNQIMNRFN